MAARLILLLKSGPGSGAKIANQAGYAFYGSRWHKVTVDKPAPKGAPLAHHPQAAGQHMPAAHFTDEQWAALKLPDTNVNAPAYNKALDKLKEWSDSGNVTAIVGAGYGTNTYGQKLAKIANHLLALYGSPHKVTSGQKAGTHAATQAPAEPAPLPDLDSPEDMAATYKDGKVVDAGPYAKLPDQLKAVLSSDMHAKVDAFVAALNSGEDEQEAFDAADFGIQAVAAQKVLAAKHGMHVVAKAPAQFQPAAEPAQKSAPAPSAGPVKMPEFAEGKTVTGVKALYEKVGQKIIDHAHAGNVSVLEGIPEPHKKMWQGKTPNSKKLLALHAEAMAYAKGETKPAAEPEPKGDSLIDGWKTAVARGKTPTKAQAEAMEALGDSDPDAYMDAFMAAVTDLIPADKNNDTDYDSALEAAHEQAHQLHADALAGGHGAGWDKAEDGSDVYANHPKEDDGPQPVSGIDDAIALEKQIKPGKAAAVDEINNALFSNYDGKFVLKDADGKVTAAIAFGEKYAPGGYTIEVHHIGSVDKGSGSKLLGLAKEEAKKKGLPIKLYATKDAIGFYEKQGFTHVGAFSTSDGGSLMQWQDGPKEGDTKPAADGGTLVLKDGHWVKQGGDDPVAAAVPDIADVPAAALLGKLQSIPWHSLKLPDSNTNAASVNKKLSALQEAAFAGDVAAIEAMKFGSNTYGKKLALAAQTVLAAIKESGTPGTAFAGSPAAAPSDEVTSLTPKQIAGLQGWIAAGKPKSKHPDSWSNLWSKLSPDLKAKVKAEAGPPPEPAKKHRITTDTPLTEDQHQLVDSLAKEALEALTADGITLPPNVKAAMKKKLADMQAAAGPKTVKAHKTTLHNTDPGHSKSWSVYVAPNSAGGFDMVTEYGKIGAKQQKTVKSFPKSGPAQVAALKLINEKKSKGYYNVSAGEIDVEVSAPGVAPPDTGPKEGDTKMGADGMLVLKDGHWVKMDADDGGWSFNASDMGMSGAATLTQDGVGMIAYEASMGAEFHSEESVAANEGEPTLQAASLDSLIQMMADAGFAVPPLHLLQKVDASIKASDVPTKIATKKPADQPMHGAPEPMDSWTQTGGQGGSNPGGKFKDPSGQEWYCKFPGDADTAKSEVLAAKLYALAGLSSQDAKLITKGGKVGIASKWVNIKKAATADALAKVPGALDGFAVDAWLGNWDVVGLSLDNLQIGPDGKAHRVDAGGSLEYRAQGAKKPFGAKVEEIDTLRDAKLNPKSAAVFGKMTDADITASVAKVVALDDDTIREVVNDYGPGDAAAKKAMADTLIARRQDLLARFPAAAKGKKKPLNKAALPVAGVHFPKPHDFQNWNGLGKGLSSKTHVNKSNEADEYQMLALAQTGNLTALEGFRFQELNKETGAPTGKLLPVSQHPSKHVQQFHQDLIQILEEVSNPPEPLKVFRSKDIGSLASLNAAFPPKKFGTTVSKVASNEKLGFWVALGAVGDPAKFKPKTVTHYSAVAIAKAKQKYATASSLAKHFIKSVQASGTYNDLFRNGKTHDSAGNSLKDVAKAALAHATEMPEGTSLFRWQAMSDAMLNHIMSAKDGTVFQATGPMCTSYDPHATKGFGKHRVTIRYAKGAKAVESFASGGFAGEKEVTTLPNARFVILSKQMVPDVEHGNPSSKRLELEILMLPPDLGIL